MITNELVSIVNAATIKDNVAMETLYKMYYPDVLFVCQKYSLNSEDACDIAQETFITAFSNLTKLQDAEKFKSWVCRIASNKCLDFLKHNKIITFDSIDDTDSVLEIPDKSKGADEVFVEKEVGDILISIIEKLPVEQRVTVFMFYYEDYSVKEIAAMYGCSENTVRSRLNYAKKFMQSEVEKLENNGIKLRCVGILPFLFAVFMSERNAFACEIPSSTGVISEVMKMGNINGVNQTVTNQNMVNQTMANQSVTSQPVTNVGGMAGASVKAASAGLSAGKVIAITAAATVLVGAIGIGAFLAINGGSSDDKDDKPAIITTEDSSYKDNADITEDEEIESVVAEEDTTEKEETENNNTSAGIDINDEEYDSTINYMCEDGLNGGNFAFRISLPSEEGHIIVTYNFKDLEGFNPVQECDYGFYQLSVEADGGRKIYYDTDYDYPSRNTYIKDSIWKTNEDEFCQLEIYYDTFMRHELLDLATMERTKEENTVEVYMEGACYVYVNVEADGTYTYKLTHQILGQCNIHINLVTDSTEINKNLVTDLIRSLSFEYVEEGGDVTGKAMAEDTLAKIVADKFNIYLKNPTCVQHMEYDELIYVYDEEQYKLYFETFPEIEKDYEYLTSYSNYDVYYEDGDYVLYDKEGAYQIKISNKDLEDMTKEEGYDLVRQLFLK